MPGRKPATVWSEDELEKLAKLKLYRNGQRQSSRFPSVKKEQFANLTYNDVKKKIFDGEWMIAKYSCDYFKLALKYISQKYPRVREVELARAARMRAAFFARVVGLHF